MIQYWQCTLGWPFLETWSRLFTYYKRMCSSFLSVLWHGWLGDGMGIWLAKILRQLSAEVLMKWIKGATKNATLDSKKRTKIGKFQFSDLVHEKILWFKVAMEDSALVTVSQATENLKHEQLPKTATSICCSAHNDILQHWLQRL